MHTAKVHLFRHSCGDGGGSSSGAFCGDDVAQGSSVWPSTKTLSGVRVLWHQKVQSMEPSPAVLEKAPVPQGGPGADSASLLHGSVT